MTLKTRLSILLLSTPVLVFVVVGGLIGRASATSGDGTIRELRVFDDVLQLVLKQLRRGSESRSAPWKAR